MSLNHVDNTKRIAKNTLMLYVRMLFSMAVSLYTTRVVLNVLGADDYGISNLVGGVVGMMGIVTSLLSQGTSRFITIALGINNQDKLRSTFSASITIHIALAVIILFLGELVGPLVIRDLNINPSRMGAAQYVFQMSLISAIIGITQSPFHAAIVAHERMNIYAYISIWDVVAKLLVVYLLQLVDIDKLKLYSSLYFIVNLITVTFYYFYCRHNFTECRNLRYKPDWGLYKDIFNYTGWNAIGACAFTMNGQGVTILLSAFGTAVNAARGIAGSVSNVVYGFVSNFQAASRPQITKLYASGDSQSMNNLIIRTSKFSAYLMGFIGVPLFIEMEYVLTLWLKNVPDFTITFARLTLLQGLIQAMDFPIGAGIHAVGRMKLPNITSAFIYMAILPITYISIKLGASPQIAYIIIVCVYPFAMFMDLYILNKYTNFPIWPFVKQVILKSLLFICLTYIIVKSTIFKFFDSNFMRVIITIFMSSVVLVPSIYSLGLTKGERNFIKNLIVEKLHRK